MIAQRKPSIAVGVVAARERRVQVSAALGQLATHLGLDVRHGFPGEVATRNTGLIGHDDHWDVRCIEGRKGLRRAREQDDLLGTTEKVGVRHEDAVAVYEQRRPAFAARRLRRHPAPQAGIVVHH